MHLERRILVSGGAGFLGSHLCEQLLARGDQVLCVDNFFYRDAAEYRASPRPQKIPRAMMALLGYLSDFSVYGDDYATADGTPIRDYIHVSDLADAHVASVQRLMQGGSSGAFNLGTGRGYSVKQVLDAIRVEAHDRLEVGRGPRRPGDPPILVADAALAGAELGFKPRQSDLKTIIATAWAWHRRAHPKKGAPNSSSVPHAVVP